jgi:hypothetical protein
LKFPASISTASILIALVFLAGGFLGGFVTGNMFHGPWTTYTTTTNTEIITITTSQKPMLGDWRELLRFSGTTQGGTTDPFNILTSAWRIRCSHAGTAGSFSMLSFGVYPEGQPSNANTIIAEGGSKGTTGSGTTYLIGPGNFYLVVLTANLAMWTIIIEVPA